MSGPEQLSLFDVCDNAPCIVVRPSARARHLSLRVFPGGRVEVVVPRRTSARSVRAFVSEQRPWIARTQARLTEQFPPGAFALPHEVSLPAVGRSHAIEYREQAGGRLVHGDRTLVIPAAADSDRARAVLRRWLAGQGRRHLVPWLERVARRTGLRFERVQIRGQRTRWGSCSASGTISLNYCLLFLASDLVEYLILHELCHTRHMNHGARFWRLVRSFEPHGRALDRRLGAAWCDVPGWAQIA